MSLARRFHLWAVAANAYARLARYDDCLLEGERLKRLAAAMAPVPSVSSLVCPPIRVYVSHVPLTSPGTRFVAAEAKATKRPSALMLGATFVRGGNASGSRSSSTPAAWRTFSAH